MCYIFVMSYSNLLFDFDGTLFDTSKGIFNSMRKVADFYNLDVDEKTFAKMIGPSLQESFTTIFKLPESEVSNAIKVYRQYYAKQGMFEVQEYEGIFEFIKEARNLNKKIFIATSKPEVYTKQILEHLNLIDYFDFVGGADMAEKDRITKVDVINYVLKESNIQNKESALMIGDRSYDINGAHQAGLKACGILWGFGSLQEMNDCSADYICEQPKDLLKLI